MRNLISTMAIAPSRIVAMWTVFQAAPDEKKNQQHHNREGAKMFYVKPVIHAFKLMHVKRVFQVATLCSFIFGQPMVAQENKMEIFETINGAQVTKVASSNVCFATINTKSANGTDSFFATYKLKNGDRWQVAGHSGLRVAQTNDILTIKFDNEPFLIRDLQLVNNTSPLPFTEDNDLTGFDERVATGKQVTFDYIRLKDSISIDLDTLRAAKDSMDRCLETIE